MTLEDPPVLKLSSLAGKTIMIHWERGDCDSIAPRELLSAILSQAMLDRMSGVELEVSADPPGAHLRYYGLDDTHSPRSWEMTAPPAWAYPFLLRAILIAAKLDASFPITGTIKTVIDGKEKILRLEILELGRFRINF